MSDDPSANKNFRRALAAHKSGGDRRGRQGGANDEDVNDDDGDDQQRQATERTSLLVPNGGNRDSGGSSRRPRSRQRYSNLGTQVAHDEARPGQWRQFLFDGHRTPGRESDSKPKRWGAEVWHITKVTLLSNYVNFLLVMVPIGIVAGKLHWDPTAVFAINFFAIIPLAAVLSFATEEISKKMGETLGGLLNATFGNAVELIVSIVALLAGEIEVVQASMLGSILSNLLLVMGMCFLLGGLKNGSDGHGNGLEQRFSSATAQTTCSLMTLASASLALPATLYSVLKENSATDKKDMDRTILTLSRGTAIILLILYALYLVFQLRTHKNLFDAESHSAESPASTEREGEAGGEVEEEACMKPLPAILVLVVTTVMVAICAEYLVDSIDSIVEKAHISKSFIGLILIPIVGNAAEHVTAVVVAWRNKMDLAMGVAIGSSIQIALLVTPFLVMVGWAIGRDMTLRFETFETVAFAFSVLVVTYTVQDGRSNYLEGAMLLGLYLIIALAFYATPSSAIDEGQSVVNSFVGMLIANS